MRFGFTRWGSVSLGAARQSATCPKSQATAVGIPTGAMLQRLFEQQAGDGAFSGVQSLPSAVPTALGTIVGAFGAKGRTTIDG